MGAISNAFNHGWNNLEARFKVRDNTEALNLIDKACQGKHGGDQKSKDRKINSDNITIDPERGTSKSYSLDRLRRKGVLILTPSPPSHPLNTEIAVERFRHASAHPTAYRRVTRTAACSRAADRRRRALAYYVCFYSYHDPRFLLVRSLSPTAQKSLWVVVA